MNSNKWTGEHFSEQNEHKDEHFFQSEIQKLSSQLTVKDEQIAELNQQLKQAQQLQLKTQLQLEAEQQKVLALETELQQEEVVSEASAKGAENKKVFWRRIFG